VGDSTLPPGAYAVQIIDDRALQPGSGTDAGLNVLAFAARHHFRWPPRRPQHPAGRPRAPHHPGPQLALGYTMRAFGGAHTLCNCSDKDLQVCARCPKVAYHSGAPPERYWKLLQDSLLLWQRCARS
jgi:hypothetical protein